MHMISRTKLFAAMALAFGLLFAPMLSAPAAAAPAASTVDMMRAIQSSHVNGVEQVRHHRWHHHRGWKRHHWKRRHCGWTKRCWHGRYGYRCRPVYRCWR